VLLIAGLAHMTLNQGSAVVSVTQGLSGYGSICFGWHCCALLLFHIMLLLVVVVVVVVAVLLL